MIQVEGIFAGGATKPYIEETYDGSNYLTDAKLYGYTYLRKGLFSDCTRLSTIILTESISTIGINAFMGCTNLTLDTLPSCLEVIGDNAFSGCANIEITTIPSGVWGISGKAFLDCKKIRTLTFMGEPMMIAADAFEGCENLTTINVPWAEGAVADAPWGAANATINYNYTGG